MKTNTILKAIRRHRSFLITTHVNPDPDALSSELAMAVFLHKLGKKVMIINEENVPKRFMFLPGIKQMKAYSQSIKSVFDVAIIVDCGDLSRIGQVQKLLTKDKLIINIDHHVTNDYFGHLNLVNLKASSTAEALYELFEGARFPFTKNLALCLYAGIMTDTGSFRYDNTTSRTHEIVSRLMKFNFSAAGLYTKFYESIPPGDLIEFVKVIRSFDLISSGQVVCLTLKKKILSKFSSEFDLRDTIFKFFRSMKSVKAVVILTQVSGRQTRVNLRASGEIDVARIARDFNGGGHKNASGCVIHRNLNEAKKAVLLRIKKDL